MKTRPILFSEPMVRAILNGSKTQTRRVCKPAENLSYVIPVSDPKATVQQPPYLTPGWFGDEEGDVAFKSPYGVPGNQLWVRETFAHGIHALSAKFEEDGPFVYAATDSVQHRLGEKWKPSIFMPRYASRITLEITNVRVERLNDINEADALAEGIHKLPALRGGYCQIDGGTPIAGTPVIGYRNLWEQINGKGSWDLNPWVWCISFRRIDAC